MPEGVTVHNLTSGRPTDERVMNTSPKGTSGPEQLRIARDTDMMDDLRRKDRMYLQ